MSGVCPAGYALAAVLLSPFVSYLIARAVFTAWFFTREQFNRRRT